MKIFCYSAQLEELQNKTSNIIIGPESDHWQCLSLTDSLTDSLTHSLTDSRLVKLIDMNLVCEKGNSKLVEVVTACRC